ncbi:hypothetical protein G6F35_009666 [Rhizopus arrhizus]|nr:hypothetical protein G6F35_009666 [Rhizopus arrhizus]
MPPTASRPPIPSRAITNLWYAARAARAATISGRYHPRGVRRPQRPALRVHRPLADRPRRADCRPGVHAEHPRLGSAQSETRAGNVERQSGGRLLPRRAGHRPRTRSEGRLRDPAGAQALGRSRRYVRAVGHPRVSGHYVSGLRPAAAAAGVRPGYGHGHPRRGACRLLLGLRRRGRSAGGPHETTGPDVGAVAQASWGALGKMSHQIVVCGAGIVGLSTALALARRGQRVAVLAPRTSVPAADPNRYHPRVYAISPASQRFLAELGVWDAMPASRLMPVEAMEIHGDADGQVNLNAWQAALPQLAWIVESGEIERVLIQAVRMFGIPWLEDRCTGYRDGAIDTESGTRIQAELFVGADGAASPLRTAAGMKHDAVSYDDTGLVVHLDAERAHQGTAIQWFRDDGVLALLPLPDTADGPQVSMVWSMRTEPAQALLAPPKAAWAG